MKMKSIIITTVLTVTALMMLSSCIDNTKKGERLTTMLTVNPSQDLLEACDIEVTYKGKGGVDITDTISDTEWYKIIVNDSFPTQVGVVSFRYLMKPGFKPTKEKYDLTSSFSISLKEQVAPIGTQYPIYLVDVPGDKVESFIDLYNFRSNDEYDPGRNNFYVLKVTKVDNDSIKHPNGSYGLYYPFDLLEIQ